MKKNSVKVIVTESNINYYGWSLISDGFLSGAVKKYIGGRLQNAVMKIEDDSGVWAPDMRAWNELGKRTVARLASRTLDLGAIHKEHARAGKELFKLCRLIHKSTVRNVNNGEIAQWFKKIWKQYFCLNVAAFIPVISDYDHFYLSEALNQIMQKHAVLGSRAQMYVGVLSSMTRPTLVWREQLALLAICKKYKTLKNIAKSREFDRHVARYLWLNYGYQGPAWTRNDFIERVKKIAADKKSVQAQHRAHREFFKKASHEQAALSKKLCLDANEKRLFAAARLFMYLKAYRVDVRHYVQYVSDTLFAELGERSALPISIFRYATRDEILDMIKGKPRNRQGILERRKRMLAVCERGTSRFIAPRSIDAYLSKVLIREEKVSGNKVFGQVAFPGVVRGTVKIVYGTEDAYKVEEGDILVAPSTMPDLLPAMNRAAAFVTDTGGITSHAAIVSREMKKPCIVGTKVATKLFKDGDRVEVDANRGVVKKI